MTGSNHLSDTYAWCRLCLWCGISTELSTFDTTYGTWAENNGRDKIILDNVV